VQNYDYTPNGWWCTSSCLNQTTRDWHSRRPALKHRAQLTKGTEVPSEPGLPGFVPWARRFIVGWRWDTAGDKVYQSSV